jgi:hypothetical protein
MKALFRVACAAAVLLIQVNTAGALVILDGGGNVAGVTGVGVTLSGSTTYYDVTFEYGEFGAVFGSSTALPAGWPITSFTVGSVAASALAAALNAEGVGNVAFTGGASGQATAYVAYSVGPQLTATASCDVCAASRIVEYAGSAWAQGASAPWVRTAATTTGASVGPDVTWARFVPAAVPEPGAGSLLLGGLAGARVAVRRRANRPAAVPVRSPEGAASDPAADGRSARRTARGSGT